jgi:hypothetical protein
MNSLEIIIIKKKNRKCDICRGSEATHSGNFLAKTEEFWE